jgi:hypothetical protein
MPQAFAKRAARLRLEELLYKIKQANEKNQIFVIMK